MVSTDGLLGLYAGLGPILFKQIPYTMAKFAVQGKAAELMYKSMNSSPDKLSKGANLSISLGSGVIAGVVAAIVSHPADTLLSKINKAGKYTVVCLFVCFVFVLKRFLVFFFLAQVLVEAVVQSVDCSTLHARWGL
jgi:CBS domain containing-hemolysin-like protein